MTTWTIPPHTPAPPDWRADWDAIARRFAWIQALAGVPQEPAYHAEGDVLAQTRMVAEALAALGAWRALPPTERGLLFAAALLHDVATPGRTRIDPDGRVTAPGHARARAARAARAATRCVRSRLMPRAPGLRDLRWLWRHVPGDRCSRSLRVCVRPPNRRDDSGVVSWRVDRVNRPAVGATAWGAWA